jgi:hypothetical protein
MFPHSGKYGKDVGVSAEYRGGYFYISILAVFDTAAAAQAVDLCVVAEHTGVYAVVTAGVSAVGVGLTVGKTLLFHHKRSIGVDQKMVVIVKRYSALAEGFKII